MPTNPNTNIPDGFINRNHQVIMTQLDQSHEQTLLQVKNQHDIDVLDKELKHQLKCIDKDLGWMGLIFGGKELIALNISGLLIFSLLFIGLCLTYIVYNPTNGITNIITVWGIIIPIIKLTLRYIFGNKSSKKTRTK